MPKNAKYKRKIAKAQARHLAASIKDGIKSYPEIRENHVTTIIDLLAAASALGIAIITIIAMRGT